MFFFVGSLARPRITSGIDSGERHGRASILRDGRGRGHGPVARRAEPPRGRGRLRQGLPKGPRIARAFGGRSEPWALRDASSTCPVAARLVQTGTLAGWSVGLKYRQLVQADRAFQNTGAKTIRGVVKGWHDSSQPESQPLPRHNNMQLRAISGQARIKRANQKTNREPTESQPTL